MGTYHKTNEIKTSLFRSFVSCFIFLKFETEIHNCCAVSKVGLMVVKKGQDFIAKITVCF